MQWLSEMMFIPAVTPSTLPSTWRGRLSQDLATTSPACLLCQPNMFVELFLVPATPNCAFIDRIVAIFYRGKWRLKRRRGL